MTCPVLDRPTRPASAPDPPRRRRPLGAGAALLALAGVLLFCHGCHGHEDDDLAGWLLPEPMRQDAGR